jgi:archaetidylinositol phosphate synthase
MPGRSARCGAASIDCGSASVPLEVRLAPRLVAITPPWDQRLARAAMLPLVGTRVTPNQITTLSLAVGGLAAWLYAAGDAAVHVGAACFMFAFWLDHADGELARLTGRASPFGHRYDLAAGGAVLIALFIGIGIGLRNDGPGAWSVALGVSAGLAIAVTFLVRIELERRAGKDAARLSNLLGFEIEDLMYLVGPITWLGLVQPFLILAGIGAPVFALFVLWQGRGVLLEQRS